MNNDTWIGKKGFRYWYYRFRDSQYYGLSIIGFTIIVCILLLSNIIIPEVTQWFSIRNEVIATQKHIATLQQNINFINNLDRNMLNSQLQTVSHALPPEKNFGYILNALSNAAVNSGVSLSDYSFQIGNVAQSQNGQADNSTGQNGMSTIELTLMINGNMDAIKHFITSLENNLPLSEITSINGTGNSASVKVQFYQKLFNNVAISDDKPLQSLTPQKAELIQNLAKWDNTSTDQGLIPQPQSGSNSATPLF